MEQGKLVPNPHRMDINHLPKNREPAHKTHTDLAEETKKDLGIVGKVSFQSPDGRETICTYTAELPFAILDTISRLYDKLKQDRTKLEGTLKKYLYVNYVSMQMRINKVETFEEKRKVMNNHFKYLENLLKTNPVFNAILTKYNLSQMIYVHAHLVFRSQKPASANPISPV